MTIGRKIALGFVSLIVLSAASGLYLLRLVDRMGEQGRRLVEVDYQAGRSALWLQNHLYEIDEFTSKFFATSQPRPYAAALQEKLDDFSGQLDHTLQLDLSTSDREIFEGFRVRWRAFRAQVGPHLQLRRTVGRDVPPELEATLGKLFADSRQLSDAVQSSLQQAVQAWRRTTRQAQWIPWLSTLLALALALGLAFTIVGSITRPIVGLVQATQRLASGDFSSRVHFESQDEIGELARNFNRMAKRLEELDQLKRDFVSHVSHDLKAPLASIQETTSLLLEGIPGPLSDKQQRLLRLNLDCTARLSAMIHNLLDLSRLEAGVARYDFQSAEFVPLVERVVAEVEPLADEKQCRVRTRLSIGDGDGVIRCDSGRMMQLIRNLLDNAVSFSPAGSAIDVEVRLSEQLPENLPRSRRPPEEGWQKGPFLWVSVSDRGPGVERLHREKVFEKFHQVKKGGKIRGQGVGLGLAISKSIVDAHGGRIWVEDNPEGGSCFCVLLPVSGPVAKVPAPSFSTL